MNMKIQSVHFDADRKLLDYVESKVSKLELFSNNIIGADVILRLENSDVNENKVAEILINIPHSSELFAKKQSKSFEDAIDQAAEALRRQLKKTKEKMRE